MRSHALGAIRLRFRFGIGLAFVALAAVRIISFYNVTAALEGRAGDLFLLSALTAVDVIVLAVCYHLVTRYVARRQQAELSLLESERFARATLDALPAHIAILNENGVIIGANRAWDEFAAANGAGVEKAGRGANYLAVCDAAAGQGCVEAGAFAAGVRAVIRGAEPGARAEYGAH